MNQSVVFSPRVLNTLNSLPVDDRSVMATALTSEFVLGVDITESLSAIQRMVYSILRFYMRSDMSRMGREIVDLRDLN